MIRDADDADDLTMEAFMLKPLRISTIPKQRLPPLALGLFRIAYQ